jgi:hypothetical protein
VSRLAGLAVVWWAKLDRGSVAVLLDETDDADDEIV